MPEQHLIGVQYNSLFPLEELHDQVGVASDTGLVRGGLAWAYVVYRPSGAYVVRDSSNWVYRGTGLHNGSIIRGLVGYEYDSYQPRYGLPRNRSYHLLSWSPIHRFSSKKDHSNSSIYQAPSGSWVFAAGTIQWTWGLDNFGAHNVVSRPVQIITANILNRFIGHTV